MSNDWADSASVKSAQSRAFLELDLGLDALKAMFDCQCPRAWPKYDKTRPEGSRVVHHDRCALYSSPPSEGKRESCQDDRASSLQSE